MIRRPPRSTRMTHSFPTRRSSDLIEDEDHRRAHEDHVGQAEPGARRARNALDQADRFIGEEADERRKRLRQSFGDVEAAFGDEIAKRPQRAGFKRRERSEEHTSELQSLMRISYAVFCLKKKNNNNNSNSPHTYSTKKHN